MYGRSIVSHHGHFLHALFAGSSSQVETDSCVSYLHFPVGHSMAPLSHLLVYYVRENGEGVTDSVQIPVHLDFENQVCATEHQIPLLLLTSQDVEQQG